MSALIPIDINGVSYQVHGEYTSSAVAQEFQNSLAAFVNIFNLGLEDPNVRHIGIDPTNPDTLVTQIRNKLNDPNFAIYLQSALLGGTVVKNYQVDPDFPSMGMGPQEETVQVVGLFNLARDGLTVTNDPVLSPGQHFLSLEMAGALKQLVKSLQLAGIDIQDDGTGNLTLIGGINSQEIQQWKNLSATSDAIRTIMQYAVDTTGNANRTLQALVELIYVRTGNELLSQNLERLEDAIAVTKNSLDALNRLQTLHNKLTAEEKDRFDSPSVFWAYGEEFRDITILAGGIQTVTFLLSPSAFVRGTGGQPQLEEVASEHFASIDPTLLEQITDSDQIEFLSLRNTLIGEIQRLSGITPASGVPGSLLERLREVLSDIHKAFSAVDVFPPSAIDTLTEDIPVTKALTRWILDSTQVANTFLNIPGIDSGKIQRNLSAAVAAGQSLNDTQKEEVRRYLFVFEEYYKSAAAILSKITQILERMAQGIAR